MKACKACSETPKIRLPMKDTFFVNKKIILGIISNGFWFIKQKNFVLENDHWMRTSMMFITHWPMHCVEGVGEDSGSGT